MERGQVAGHPEVETDGRSRDTMTSPVKPEAALQECNHAEG